MPDFLVYALLAGGLIALIAGPLGSFMVWNRMAYFGDTLAHSALLGVALGILLKIDIMLAVFVGCALVAVLLFFMQKKHTLSTDTLLGILSHSSLALGLVIISFVESVRMDLMGYLFGDLLAIGTSDLFWIAGIVLVAGVLIFWKWRELLAITVHEDLAAVEGLPTKRLRLMMLITTALVIAVGMKVVGVLLITALLIIPAATARKRANTPEQMAWLASVIGLIAVCLGLSGSWIWDTPAGPSIVTSAALLFILMSLLPGTRKA